MINKIIEYNNNNFITIEKSHLFHKVIFLLTNLIFLLPLIFFGLNRYTILILLMGTISTLYHSSQCKKNNCRHKMRKLLWCDIIIVNILGFIIWFKFKKFTNIFWYILFLISLGFFLIPTDGSVLLYMYAHGLWDIINGFLLLYLIYQENKNNTI